MHQAVVVVSLLLALLVKPKKRYHRREQLRRYSTFTPAEMRCLRRLVGINDYDCGNHFRMYHHAFGKSYALALKGISVQNPTLIIFSSMLIISAKL